MRLPRSLPASPSSSAKASVDKGLRRDKSGFAKAAYFDGLPPTLKLRRGRQYERVYSKTKDEILKRVQYD
jgi:hypothetical protein